MLYPFLFEPIPKERVWGGRRLEHFFQKKLPAGLPIGESWEITDRPEGVSVIRNGSLAGRDLRWLMENEAAALLGNAQPLAGRFPLLVKALDAQDTLSLQVHPPASVAASLGGEPKNEMWYIIHAEPGAEIFMGFRRGVDRGHFRQCLDQGTVAGCFHRVPVRAGDVAYLPSGRVHALGAGLVLFEIQQNSDTTYRVFDWNRLGLDGKPRQLHREKAEASIDFYDIEPALVEAPQLAGPPVACRPLVQDPSFKVVEFRFHESGLLELSCSNSLVVGLVSGRLTLQPGPRQAELAPGSFCLVPASLERVRLWAAGPAVGIAAWPENT